MSAPEASDEFVLAGYRLTQQLGSGRYGDSWLAEADEGVAVIKMLATDPPDAAAAERFLAEAERFTHLRAPGVAGLLTAGALPDGRVYLVFEHAGDASLADVLRAQARLSPPRALDVCAEVADGLHAGHLRGMLHRNLKAANVALWTDRDGNELARILDYPTGHLAAAGRLPEQPLPLASAATISPEEVRGEPVDRRADLYALGVLLYQSLTGRLPVTGMTAGELLRSHRDHPPLSLRDAGRKLPQLEEIVAKLLKKKPGERPSTAREVAEELRALAPLVTDDQHPRPPRAVKPAEEPVLPAAAPRLEPKPLIAAAPVAAPQPARPQPEAQEKHTEPAVAPAAQATSAAQAAPAAQAVEAAAPAPAAGQPHPAVKLYPPTEQTRAPTAEEIAAVSDDPEKTPPGGINVADLSERDTLDPDDERQQEAVELARDRAADERETTAEADLPVDAPTPAEGLPLPTPRSSRITTPPASARPAPPPPPPPPPLHPPASASAPPPAQASAPAHVDFDTTPPDPIMATVGQLAPTPRWVPEQAARIAELHELQEQHFPQSTDEMEPITGPITGPVSVEREHDDESPEVTAEHTAEELLGDQAALLAPATSAPQPTAAPAAMPAARQLEPADETPLLGFKIPVPAEDAPAPEPVTLEEEPAAPAPAAVAAPPAPAAPSPLVTAKIPRPIIGEDEEPEPTRPGVRPPEGPKLLRRKRGEKVAFSGGKKAGVEATLLKLGLGLVAVLAVLVFVFMQVLSSGDEPKKKRSPGAQSEVRKAARATKAKSASDDE